MLQRLRAPAIHRALTGPESPNPVAVSERQVREHMRAVERSWLDRASREAVEVERAKAIAIAEETARTALARSTLNVRSNVGVGYFNAAIKAQELIARLHGLAAPTRQEVSGPGGGPIAVAPFAFRDHPAEHLDPAEEADRLRLLLADAERRAAGQDAGVDDDPGAPEAGGDGAA
jgi:hypothetical protein